MISQWRQGKLCFPSGGVQSNNWTQAALMELKQETGISIVLDDVEREPAYFLCTDGLRYGYIASSMKMWSNSMNWSRPLSPTFGNRSRFCRFPFRKSRSYRGFKMVERFVATRAMPYWRSYWSHGYASINLTRRGKMSNTYGVRIKPRQGLTPGRKTNTRNLIYIRGMHSFVERFIFIVRESHVVE
jgi:hypothetical protein